MRLDLFLVQMKLANSRSHAQELIKAGQVFQKKSNDQCVVLKKANFQVADVDLNIFVTEGPANRFVSRGGLKLEGGLERAGISVLGKNVLDVGISTGGFTDCLLQKGAASVLGVDVGHGQIHPSLASHVKLKILEGLNAREIGQDPRVRELMPSDGFDLIVMDVSFISVVLIIPQLPLLLKAGGLLLSLVKPQFEVGAKGLGKGGLVKDPGLYSEVEDRVRKICLSSGLSVRDYFASPIEGKDGNKEFFVLVQK